MEALILTVFVSLVLSALAVGLFIWDVRQGGHDHHDRLSLLPLETRASHGDHRVTSNTMNTDKGDRT